MTAAIKARNYLDNDIDTDKVNVNIDEKTGVNFGGKTNFIVQDKDSDDEDVTSPP